MSRSSSTILNVVGAIVCLAASASAGPITWSISGAFDDGGTISGSFVYDASTNVYSSIAVTTTTGSTLTGADYILYNPCCSSSADFLLLVTATGDLTGTPVLSADLVSPMTNAGGVIPLATASSDLAFLSEESCLNSGCTGPTGAERYVVSGDVSSTVPEPGTFLLALPICALIASRRTWLKERFGSAKL